jgi:hypothetical protein
MTPVKYEETRINQAKVETFPQAPCFFFFTMLHWQCEEIHAVPLMGQWMEESGMCT